MLVANQVYEMGNCMSSEIAKKLKLPLYKVSDIISRLFNLGLVDCISVKNIEFSKTNGDSYTDSDVKITPSFKFYDVYKPVDFSIFSKKTYNNKPLTEEQVDELFPKKDDNSVK